MEGSIRLLRGRRLVDGCLSRNGNGRHAKAAHEHHRERERFCDPVHGFESFGAVAACSSIDFAVSRSASSVRPAARYACPSRLWVMKLLGSMLRARSRYMVAIAAVCCFRNTLPSRMLGPVVR